MSDLKAPPPRLRASSFTCQRNRRLATGKTSMHSSPVLHQANSSVCQRMQLSQLGRTLTDQPLPLLIEMSHRAEPRNQTSPTPLLIRVLHPPDAERNTLCISQEGLTSEKRFLARIQLVLIMPSSYTEGMINLDTPFPLTSGRRPSEISCFTPFCFPSALRPFVMAAGVGALCIQRR